MEEGSHTRNSNFMSFQRRGRHSLEKAALGFLQEGSGCAVVVLQKAWGLTKWALA